MVASSPARSTSKRLVAALVASAFVHVVLTSAVKPGTARGDRAGISSVPASARITARLVPPEFELATEPVAPTREPMHVEEPVRKVDKAPRTIDRVTVAKPDGASAGPADIPDPTYYAVRQLDVFPALVTALDLQHSPDTNSAGVNGYVLLLVLIDATGAVDDVSVVESHPPRQFDDGARHAFQSARFTAAMRQGRAVKSRVLIHVNYGTGEVVSR